VHNNVVTNYFTYLNNDPMIKDLFFKHEGEKRWRVQIFTLAPYIDGLGVPSLT